MFGTSLNLGVVVRHELTTEGAFCHLFSRAMWSDGASEDVGYAPVRNIDEILVRTSSSSLVLTEPESTVRQLARLPWP